MTRENPCALDESDAIALTRAFEALGSGLREQAVRDLFALGCYVHAIGSPEGRDAGSKACLAAMDALQLSSPGLHRKILWHHHRHVLQRSFAASFPREVWWRASLSSDRQWCDPGRQSGCSRAETGRRMARSPSGGTVGRLDARSGQATSEQDRTVGVSHDSKSG